VLAESRFRFRQVVADRRSLGRQARRAVAEWSAPPETVAPKRRTALVRFQPEQGQRGRRPEHLETRGISAMLRGRRVSARRARRAVQRVRRLQRLPWPGRAARCDVDDHLPRVDQRIEPEDTTCPTPECRKPIVRVGEDISERQDIVPAKFFVQRQIRGKWACKCPRS